MQPRRDIDFELESSRQLSDSTVAMNNAATLSFAFVIYFITERYLRFHIIARNFSICIATTIAL